MPLATPVAARAADPLVQNAAAVELNAVLELRDEIVVKTKNKFYEMRSTLAQLEFNVIRFVPHPFERAESKVFLSKRLGQHVIDAHRSRRSVVQG